MQNIKIFVSRRIDINSVHIDNPLYVPVRCGAVFDKENRMGIAGDDTGENISGKRMSFCEFTVQYWAWKNVQADYYGLCHYRRYLSFAEKNYAANDHGLLPCAILSAKTANKFGLLDREKMAAEISNYELIYPEPAPVQGMPLPQGSAKTVRQLWEAHDGIFFEKRVIDRMFELIDELAPQYSRSAREYFSSSFHIGYNCYIMKRPLFERLCQFQFPIMEKLERELDTTGYSSEMLRTPAYVGEMLFGIFVYHVVNREPCRARPHQLILFGETRSLSRTERVLWHLKFRADSIVRGLAAPFFPLGSKRREVCKEAYYRLTGRKK